MYGLLHTEIEIVGIVTGYGNVTQEQATSDAAYLMQLAGSLIHDVVTMMAVVNPFMIEYVYRKVDVDLEGSAKGESIADFRPQPGAKALGN